MNSSRSRITSQEGVPDLTPHINDPTEHLRNIFKGFCGLTLDLGDRRSQPVVERATIEAHQRSAPEVCGFLCMDSHSKEVEPCFPCKSQEVELSSAVSETPATNGGRERSVDVRMKQLSLQEETIMVVQDDASAYRIMDILMATVVILFLSVYALRQYGHSFDLAMDHKSFAESQLLVMGDDINEAVWNPWSEAESSPQGGDECLHSGDNAAS